MTGWGNYVMKNKLLLSPVTALYCGHSFLLSGVGPYLQVYSLDTSKKLKSCQVFVDAVIHGIKYDTREKRNYDYGKPLLFCVFGSKQLRLLQLDQQNYGISFLTGSIELHDWIWDIAWLKKTDSFEASSCSCSESINLACVLGHNSVQSIEFKNGEIVEEVEVHCEEKCIVYSALCIGNTWEDLVVASGTVFNQVVLWQPSNTNGGQQRTAVLHRLKGHEGVIFSIDYSCEKQLLVSVSDDRSIRLWKILTSSEDDDSANKQTNICHNIESQSVSTVRNTPLNLGSVHFSEWKVLYGHTARVWQAKILTDYIISVGEDATCCVWNYDGQVVMKYKGHKGKSIWSLSVSDDEKTMVTGGGDCSIRMWSLVPQDVIQSLPQKTNVLNIPEEKNEDFPRIVQLIDDEKFLAMTNEGVLWSYSIGTMSWEKLLEDSMFKSYSVLSCLKYANIYALGSIHGSIKIDYSGCWIEQNLYKGKVHSILWLSESDEFLNKKLLTTGPDGSIDVWEIDPVLKVLKQLYQYVLPYTKQRWVSAATLLTKEHFLICGDRGGTVHIYMSDGEEKCKDPIQSFWKLHGKSGVTDIRYHKGNLYSAGRDGHYRVYSILNGKVNLMSCTKAYKGLEWIAKQQFRGDDLLVLGFHTDQFIVYSTSTNQKLVIVPCGGGHRAWDFLLKNNEQGNYHFIYIKNKDVVSCQGQITTGHKIIQDSLHGRELCDLKHITTYENCDFFVTASEDTDINIITVTAETESQSASSEKLATLQGHLSSVRTLALSEASTQSELQINARKAGDKDGDKQVDSSSGDISNTQVESKLLFSGGGRAEMKAWKISTKMENCTVGSLEDHLPVDTLNGEAVDNLKSSDKKSVKCWHEYLATNSLTQKTKLGYKPWKKKDYDPDPETRYMDLTAFNISNVDNQGECPDHLHIIVAACSDAFVRIIGFNERTKEFQILAECSYHDHCVLKVKHLILPDSTSSSYRKKIFVLSAGTGGKLAIWNLTSLIHAYIKYQQLTGDKKVTLINSEGDSLLEMMDLGDIVDMSVPVITLEVHQSGVNSLDIWELSDCEIMVATGGDDNAIKLTHLANTLHDAKESFTVVRQSKEICSHVTQVTGIKWLNAEYLISASIDQKLILWRVDEEMNMKLLRCKFINVADVSNMDMWKIGHGDFNLGLCGVGLQCFHLHAETD